MAEGLKERRPQIPVEAGDTNAEEGDIEGSTDDMSVGRFLKNDRDRSWGRDFQTEGYQVLWSCVEK